MRRPVVLVLGLIALLLAGCGGSSGFVQGTVDNKVALTFRLGMSESDVKHGVHGAPLDTIPFNPGGVCIYYRGIDKSASTGFTTTQNEWMFCFQQNKLSKLLRTCGARWTSPTELDRYKKAGYHINTAPYYGNQSDCTH